MLVTAIKRGFFGGQSRKEGDKFECPTEKEFSENWMSKEDDFEPEVLDNSEATKGEEIKRESLEVPDLTNKPKRKRRTPAEMAAARAKEEAAKKEK